MDTNGNSPFPRLSKFNPLDFTYIQVSLDGFHPKPTRKLEALLNNS